jgi:ABC-type uncharacterized transport system substrate-binding protein
MRSILKNPILEVLYEIKITNILKHKTLNTIYNSLKDIRHKHSGNHGKISYKYFYAIVEAAILGKVKLVFLHTGKDLLVFISTDLNILGKEILPTYKKS